MTKNIAKVAFILFAISAVCTALCAIVNEITAPAIALNTESTRLNALEAVSAGYEIGDQMEGDGGSISYAIPLMDNGNTAGYILEIMTSGYGGEMAVIASYSTDGTVLGAKLMSNSETPGLGLKANEPAFKDQFVGKDASGDIERIKTGTANEQQFNALSGATYTSTAVGNALNAAIRFFNNISEG